MEKSVREQFDIFLGKDAKPDDWLWCRKCHRCYKAFWFRKSEGEGKIFLFCHYSDCIGDLPLDSKPWKKLTKENPGLPAIPEKGKVYNLGSDSQREERTRLDFSKK